MRLNKIISTNDLKTLSLDKLIELYKNGYAIEETEVTKVENLATCSGTIVQGTVKPITMTPSSGTPPYRLDFYVDGVSNGSWTGITGPQTFNHTFNESLGTHTYSVKVTDSCSTPQTNTDQCSINITAPPLGTITISGCTTSINPGQTCQLIAVCKDGNGNTVVCPTLTWQSSAPLMATVSAYGLVTGVAPGLPLITASATGYATSNSIMVTVSCPLPGISFTI
jgi:uncharacterized protein YjdB